MYNRYIPQSDGTYRKNRMPERQPEQPSPPQPAPPPPCQEPHPEPHRPVQSGSVSGFLRRLLPKDFDTGDLIIVLLLLLMAEHSEEDKNSALLTLALYFFM